jgi:hypothetical protein
VSTAAVCRLNLPRAGSRKRPARATAGLQADAERESLSFKLFHTFSLLSLPCSSAVDCVGTKEQPSAESALHVCLREGSARPQDTSWNSRQGCPGQGRAVMALRTSCFAEPKPWSRLLSFIVCSCLCSALCALSLRALAQCMSFVVACSDHSCPLLPFLHVNVRVRRRPSQRRCRNDASS